MYNKFQFKIIQIRSMRSFSVEITRDKRMFFLVLLFVCVQAGYAGVAHIPQPAWEKQASLPAKQPCPEGCSIENTKDHLWGHTPVIPARKAKVGGS